MQESPKARGVGGGGGGMGHTGLFGATLRVRISTENRFETRVSVCVIFWNSLLQIFSWYSDFLPSFIIQRFQSTRTLEIDAVKTLSALPAELSFRAM